MNADEIRKIIEDSLDFFVTSNRHKDEKLDWNIYEPYEGGVIYITIEKPDEDIQYIIYNGYHLSGVPREIAWKFVINDLLDNKSHENQYKIAKKENINWSKMGINNYLLGRYASSKNGKFS